MTFVEIVFWASLAAVVYVWFGYPALLWLWARLAPRPVAKGANEPTVSLILAARNEGATILRKLENCRELDYPREKVEIVVSLDAPSDGTEEAVRSFEDPDLRLIVSAVHDGKATALNRAVAVSSGEVLVFCDARQRIAPDSLRALVENLADPEVGSVTGELVLLDDERQESGNGVGLYWRYEKAIRALESRIHSTVGATGALYACRRELWQPIPAHAILDDVIVPMRTVLAGRRTVYEPGAKAYDRVLPAQLEFPRKVRTLAGNFQLMTLVPALLVPWENPVFLQFLSHKVGRLLVPHLLVVVLVTNLMLLHGIYLSTLAVQGVFYLLAALGALTRGATDSRSAVTLVWKGDRP